VLTLFLIDQTSMGAFAVRPSGRVKNTSVVRPNKAKASAKEGRGKVVPVSHWQSWLQLMPKPKELNTALFHAQLAGHLLEASHAATYFSDAVGRLQRMATALQALQSNFPGAFPKKAFNQHALRWGFSVLESRGVGGSEAVREVYARPAAPPSSSAQSGFGELSGDGLRIASRGSKEGEEEPRGGLVPLVDFLNAGDKWEDENVFIQQEPEVFLPSPPFLSCAFPPLHFRPLTFSPFFFSSLTSGHGCART